jgi:Chitobiase/beta-hexosaminidase C-terminal domain
MSRRQWITFSSTADISAFFLLLLLFSSPSVTFAQSPPDIALDEGARQPWLDNEQASQQATQVGPESNQQAMHHLSTYAVVPYPKGYGRADKPHISPHSGHYSAGMHVTILEGVPKASIFYTLDGSEPSTLSTPYVGPIAVNATAWIKAIERSPIYSPSKVATTKYIIK